MSPTRLFNDDNQMLNTLDWAGLGGLIVGGVGILLSVIFYLKTRRVKRLAYMVKSFTLITQNVSSISGFEALYRAQPLVSLTASKIVLWNHGNEIINYTDLSSVDRLRVEVSLDQQMLDVRMAEQSDVTNLFKITDESHESKNPIKFIEFDYIAARQGCVISVLHTGSANESPRIIGTIKGAGHPIRVNSLGINRSIRSLLMSAHGALTTAILLSFFEWYTGSYKWLYMFIIGLIALMSAVALSMYFSTISRLGGEKIDKEFEGDFVPEKLN